MSITGFAGAGKRGSPDNASRKRERRPRVWTSLRCSCLEFGVRVDAGGSQPNFAPYAERSPGAGPTKGRASPPLVAKCQSGARQGSGGLERSFRTTPAPGLCMCSVRRALSSRPPDKWCLTLGRSRRRSSLARVVGSTCASTRVPLEASGFRFGLGGLQRGRASARQLCLRRIRFWSLCWRSGAQSA